MLHPVWNEKSLQSYQFPGMKYICNANLISTSMRALYIYISLFSIRSLSFMLHCRLKHFDAVLAVICKIFKTKKKYLIWMLLLWRRITLYSFHGCIHNKFAIDMHLNECIWSLIFKHRNYFRLVDWKCATETPNADQISMFLFSHSVSLAMRTQVDRNFFFFFPKVLLMRNIFWNAVCKTVLTALPFLHP